MKQLKNKNKMSGRIYSIPNGHQLQGGMDACEAKREDIEDRFVRSLAEMICEKLEIGYNDRRITNTFQKFSKCWNQTLMKLSYVKDAG